MFQPYSNHQAHHDRNTQKESFVYFDDDGPDDSRTAWPRKTERFTMEPLRSYNKTKKTH
jgi:hypothetical protein